jgi:hypothetical protein
VCAGSDQLYFTNIGMSRPYRVAKHSNMVAVGGQIVTVHGQSFGPYSSSIQARIGHSACESSGWTSDTAAFCKVSEGVAATLRLAVTAGLQLGTVTHALSYNVPSLREAFQKIANAPTKSNGEALRVHGSMFGTSAYSGGMRFGSTSCERTTWDSDSSMRCMTPSGVMQTRRVAVTVGVRVGTLTEIFSYNIPSLVNMTIDPENPIRANCPTTGASLVEVQGTNFAIVDYSPSLRAGGSGCEMSKWVSETSVRCKMAAGIQATMRLVVTHGVSVGTVSRVLSYDAPTVKVVPATVNHATTGKVTVSVHGANFGKTRYSMAARAGGTSMQQTAWVSDTAVTAKMPMGLGGTLRVMLTAGVQVGTLTEALSYDIPSLSSVTGAGDHPATGKTSTTVSGVDFGLFASTVGVRAGFTACESSGWVSDSSVVCKISAGVSRTLRLSVTAGVQVGTRTYAMSYKEPTLTSVAVTNHATTGGSILTVSGANFGTVDVSVAARVGGTASISTWWKSDTGVTARVATGVASTLRVAMTAGVQVGTREAAVSYDAPSLVSLQNPGDHPATGTTVFSVTGVDFGVYSSSIGVRAGGSSCEASEWTSDTLVSCKVAAGVSRTLRVAVTGGVLVGTLTKAMSYHAPVVAGVNETTNHAATGGSSMTVSGAHFGTVDTSVKARIGGTAASASVWVSDSAVVARVSAGVGGALRVAVTAGVIVGTVSEASSYDAPSVVSVAGAGTVPTTGQTSITMSGADFGTYSSSVAARAGGTACESSGWVSDSSVICKVPAGSGSALQVSVTTAVQVGTLTKAMNYSAPILTVIDFAEPNPTSEVVLSLSNHAPAGGSDVTVSGANFGTVDMSIQMRIGGTAALQSVWVGEDAVWAKVSPGLGTEKAIVTTVSMLAGTLEGAISYDAPSLLSVQPAGDVPTAGQSNITVSGSNFGVFSSSVAVRAGFTSCEASYWISDTSVICKLSSGAGLNLGVSVTSSMLIGTLTEALSYALPNITSAERLNFPARGGISFTLSGQNFGTTSYSITLTFGATLCPSTSWESDSSIVCKAPSGVTGTSEGYDITVTMLSTTSRFDANIVYDMPEISNLLTSTGSTETWDITNLAGPPQGGNVVTITGTDFGINNYSPTVKIGAEACKDASWISDTSIKCTVPPAGGASGWGTFVTSEPTNTTCQTDQACLASYPVEVTVGSQKSRATNSTLHYVYDCQCDSSQCLSNVKIGDAWYCSNSTAPL